VTIGRIQCQQACRARHETMWRMTGRESPYRAFRLFRSTNPTQANRILGTIPLKETSHYLESPSGLIMLALDARCHRTILRQRDDLLRDTKQRIFVSHVCSSNQTDRRHLSTSLVNENTGPWRTRSGGSSMENAYVRCIVISTSQGRYQAIIPGFVRPSVDATEVALMHAVLSLSRKTTSRLPNLLLKLLAQVIRRSLRAYSVSCSSSRPCQDCPWRLFPSLSSAAFASVTLFPTLDPQ
jgi:hypothetical protein